MKYLLEGEETSRLKFRLLESADFDLWLELFKQKNIAKFLGFDVTLSPEELCRTWFDKVFDRYKNNLGGMNVLIDKDTNAFVGQCGLLIQTVEEEERMEIGYSMLPSCWGKGYATEAAVKCKNYAFENNLTENLISIVHIENIGSEKVARKNGMELEKKINSYKGIPVNVFGINKNRWDAENFE